MPQTTPTPVVVVGRGLTVLGTIRALGRRRIPVYCLDSQPDFVSHSRYYRPTPGQTERSEFDRGLLERLPYRRMVVIACSDHDLSPLADLVRAQSDRFHGSFPTPHTISLLTHKALFYQRLEQLNIPHPRTRVLKNLDSLSSLDDKLIVDSFLKPDNSQAFGRAFRAKAFCITSRTEAEKRLREAQKLGLTMMLQRYIQGPEHQHYFIDGFVDRKGEVKAAFARRRLRMFPADFGNSSYLVSVALKEVAPAWQSLQRLLSNLKYRGIFSAEFKRDAEDDDFKLLEINARPWWYVGFAADCGVDTIHQAYLDALGKEVPPRLAYPAGATFVYPAYDSHACRQLREQGRMTRLTQWQQWLAARQAIWAWDDARPSLRDWLNGIKAKLRPTADNKPEAEGINRG